MILLDKLKHMRIQFAVRRYSVRVAEATLPTISMTKAARL